VGAETAIRWNFWVRCKQFWVGVDTALDIFGASANSRCCDIGRCHFGWVFIRVDGDEILVVWVRLENSMEAGSRMLPAEGLRIFWVLFLVVVADDVERSSE
jgi:hypothetical protein